MTYDCIAQCWFRFLHIIQNPVDLSRPEIIGKTHKFMQAAMNSETLVDPTQHECLSKLPLIFYKAMKGVSVMVNAFLGQFLMHRGFKDLVQILYDVMWFKIDCANLIWLTE